MRRTGTMGRMLVANGVRERMSESGMSGRLRKACQGQFDGSSVRKRSYILGKGSTKLRRYGIGRVKGLTLGQGISAGHMHRMQY